ncbi:MAG: folate-binding protein YgfZ [Planctomycetaceae bacterium]|nr:folate-binding protein YgfZ [Planctomycetaceae bacterium]
MTVAEQYRAATERAAMFDVSDSAMIEVTGRDRATFLHSFCTNDIKKLQPGQGCEAFVTNVKGRIVGHVLVFAEDESLWIDGDPGTQAVLLGHLNRYVITEDVEFHDRTGEFARSLVCGPAAVVTLAEQFGVSAARNPMYGGQHGLILAEFGLRRVPWSVAPAFLFMHQAAAMTDLVAALRAANVVPANGDVLELLRIEAMWPRYGVDLTEDYLAQEAGRTAQAISFTKGCYLGQEPIARLDALGHTNRELRGIRFEMPGEVTAGTQVLDAIGAVEVGAISSVATHPVTNCPVALAMLKTVANAPGTTVLARTPSGTDLRGVVFGPPPII